MDAVRKWVDFFCEEIIFSRQKKQLYVLLFNIFIVVCPEYNCVCNSRCDQYRQMPFASEFHGSPRVRGISSPVAVRPGICSDAQKLTVLSLFSGFSFVCNGNSSKMQPLSMLTAVTPRFDDARLRAVFSPSERCKSNAINRPDSCERSRKTLSSA